jgi:hypothetical protein
MISFPQLLCTGKSVLIRNPCEKQIIMTGKDNSMKQEPDETKVTVDVPETKQAEENKETAGPKQVEEEDKETAEPNQVDKKQQPKRKRSEGKETNVKRNKTKSKKVENPLDLLKNDEVSPYNMKKSINNWQATQNKFVIPKPLRKTIRSIVGHSTKIEDKEILAEITDLYKAGLANDAIKYMANCILYYEKQHNVDIRKKDLLLIERSGSRPERVTLEKMQEVYKFYLCGMEDQHGYYIKYLRSGVNPNDCPNRERPEPTSSAKTRPVKHMPYNLFIKQQWKDRRVEFQGLSKQNGIAEVMKLLSTEWKNNPLIKVDYQAKCDVLNMVPVDNGLVLSTEPSM